MGELMTFADASSNSSTLPAEIGLAYNRMHHWAYTDTFNSYAGRIFNAADEVDTPIHTTFGNATHGMLRATSPDDQWLITKLDKDRWRRDTVFAADGPVGGARVSYILTRVVREDGSPHPTYFGPSRRTWERGSCGSTPPITCACGVAAPGHQSSRARCRSSATCGASSRAPGVLDRTAQPPRHTQQQVSARSLCGATTPIGTQREIG